MREKQKGMQMNRKLKRMLALISVFALITAVGCGKSYTPPEATQSQTTEQDRNTQQTQSQQQEDTKEETNEETTQPVDTDKYLEEYAEVLDAYYYGLKSKQTYDDFWIEKPFNTMATYAYSKDGYDKEGSLDYTGFCFMDLDNDGTCELLIGNLSDDEKLDKMIYLISTIHNNVPYPMFTSSEWYYYYLCKDNKLCSESHDTEDKWDNDYYMFEFSNGGSGINCIDRIWSYKGDNDEILWKRNSLYSNENELSEKEANAAKDELYAARIQPDLTPFSEYSPKNPEDCYVDDAGTAFGKGYSSWQEGYIAYLDETKNYKFDDYSYALIYVDEDDVPELVCYSGIEAGGSQILTYYDGQVNVLQTARLSFSYIEKSGLLCNDGGHMGFYYDHVYRLQNGKWIPTFEGDYFGIDESQEDAYDEETGRFRTLNYMIDGKETDEQTYLSRLREVYDEDKAKEPESYLLIDDLMSYLKTGKMASADHRYELIIEDCTWKEAEKKCKEKGGYLASMTCDEEFDVVDALIRSEGKQDYYFYIGANRLGDRSWHWTEPGLTQTQNKCTGSGYRKHWLAKEPSYRSKLADGMEIKEEYAEYFYQKSDDKFYINDIPNDVIFDFPEYKGCMGYICEYEQ
ncbi:hypothetical protein D6853_08385 [Butyrivibrio sp. X503]|nr:hypothetical protein D6853_08385 [Butyrivibrio sp. X503]